MSHHYIIPLVPMTTNNSYHIINIPLKDGSGRTRPAIMLTGDAKKWMERAIQELQVQRMQAHAQMLRCRCSILLVVYRVTDVGDVDNYSKGVLDAIAKAGIIENDRLFKDMRVILKVDKSNPRTVITINELAHDGELFT